MISNASLKQLGEMLKAAESILIFPHINIDGDALGSAAALCRALRDSGKTAWIMMDEDVPAYLSFMDTEFCTTDRKCIAEPDVCICVDCSDTKRFPAVADIYAKGRLQLCIDHHATGGSFGDHYYIDGDEAATCQLIYKLLKEMDAEITPCIAESLYTGISTDTGNFQYSNTAAETHRIAADLLECGVDHVGITVKLYQTVPLRKLQTQTKILDRMEILADGRAAISYVTQEMLDELGAQMDDSEGSIDLLRNIEGVEIAAFLKEKGDTVKVSMRAKSYATVDGIVMKFGGGGHAKAAGCTLEMGMDDALELMKKEIIDYWEK